MAYNLTALPNTDPAAGDNLYGDLVDDPAGLVGTPLEKLTLHDIFVTFQRMAAQAGITLNDSPDNDSGPRTWQFSEALGGEAWLDGPTLTFSAVGGGSISGGTVDYNKYRIVGKTMYWQVKYTGATIAALTTLIVVNSPISAGGVNFPADGMRFRVAYNDNSQLSAFLNGPTGFAQVSIEGTFVIASGQDIYLDIVAEIP